MTQSCLLYLFLCGCLAAADPIAVISHRGEHLHHPENTIEAYQASIAAGADFIEVDVRTSSDGKLVVMHNATVDEQTNGTGAVKEMTFAQIRSLRVAGHAQVPTFDEVLALAKGKIGIYVDSKAISATDLIAALERHGMQDHVVVYGAISYLKEIASLRHKIKLMPEAMTADTCRQVIQELHPKVIAFGARDFTDENIAIAKQASADIYVDRLGPFDNPASWQDAIDRGATGIQTDKPSELVAYLRSKGRHR